MGFAHTQMGFAHTQMGASPHTPTLRAYARRGGIKLNIIIVHASIQAMGDYVPSNSLNEGPVEMEHRGNMADSIDQ